MWCRGRGWRLVNVPLVPRETPAPVPFTEWQRLKSQLLSVMQARDGYLALTQSMMLTHDITRSELRFVKAELDRWKTRAWLALACAAVALGFYVLR